MYNIIADMGPHNTDYVFAHNLHDPRWVSQDSDESLGQCYTTQEAAEADLVWATDLADQEGILYHQITVVYSSEPPYIVHSGVQFPLDQDGNVQFTLGGVDYTLTVAEFQERYRDYRSDIHNECIEPTHNIRHSEEVRPNW